MLGMGNRHFKRVLLLMLVGFDIRFSYMGFRLDLLIGTIRFDFSAISADFILDSPRMRSNAPKRPSESKDGCLPLKGFKRLSARIPHIKPFEYS
jgi:hypothetical protein